MSAREPRDTAVGATTEKRARTRSQERLLKSILEENAKAAERRHKLDLQKIVFATTLLGLGSAEWGKEIDLSRALYVAPVVAIFYDMMVMGQHFVIKRNNAFLRCATPDPMDKRYRAFLSRYRDRVFRFGSRGFTLVAIVGSFALYLQANPDKARFAAAWFGLSLLGYLVLLVFVYRSQRRLDGLTSL